MNFPESYQLIKKDEIPEISANAYVLKHKKSGAKVLCMETDDDNKVFSITFRTTPFDSTGVPHIMEHSVLCGSEKYPVKDPFVELCKSSLNTFLNALTWPDKTMYPVASCNDRDFRNLMSVYLDAVFYPNIYKQREIFEQEGWHYELNNEEDELKINGVVYNEMRGAFSNPDSIAEDNLLKNLYPDSTYAVVSGGDPSDIPNLAYEKFLDFHRTYYHPSNSYIYLYGNVDFYERLDWMDKEYLSKFDAIPVNSEILLSQKTFMPKTAEVKYSIAKDAKKTANFFYAKAIDCGKDIVKEKAIGLIAEALLTSDGSPIRRALIEAGIGKEIGSYYDTSIKKPMLVIYAKEANPEDFSEFKRIIEDTLRSEIKNGFNRRRILAALHSAEYKLREADYGAEPTGLIYLYSVLSTWLYDDDEVTSSLYFKQPFKQLRDEMENGYFEKTARELILENPHEVCLKLTGEENLSETEDRMLKEKLAKIKAGFSQNEIRAIVQNTKHLKEYQDAQNDEKDLLKIPHLERKDLPVKVKPMQNVIRKWDENILLYHPVKMQGIGQLIFYFPLDGISLADFPYVSLLGSLYGLLDTKNYAYSDLVDEISLYTGGISSDVDLLASEAMDGPLYERFFVSVKYLKDDAKKALELTQEVFRNTNFGDKKRLLELISEKRIQLETSLETSAHRTAKRRALAMISLEGYETEICRNVTFYQFLWDLEKNWNEKADSFIEKIKNLSEKIFNKKGTQISIAGDEETLEETKKYLPIFWDGLENKENPKQSRNYSFPKRNEAIIIPSKVYYTSISANSRKFNIPYSSGLSLISVIMRYEYLWQNIRVKGGAYGCVSSFTQNGDISFATYRDPHIRNTLRVLKEIPEYLRTLQLTKDDRTKYLIGAFGDILAPVHPFTEAIRDDYRYQGGWTDELRQRNHDELLSASIDDLRNFSALFEKVLETAPYVVVGGESKILSEKELFDSIINLKGESAI